MQCLQGRHVYNSQENHNHQISNDACTFINLEHSLEVVIINKLLFGF